MACETDVEYQITIGPQKRIRLQILDDGAGEYVYDVPINSINAAGVEVPVGSTATMGPFLLPSPLAVCKNGLLNLSLTNVEATDLDVLAHMVLIFAVPKPKECR